MSDQATRPDLQSAAWEAQWQSGYDTMAGIILRAGVVALESYHLAYPCDMGSPEGQGAKAARDAFRAILATHQDMLEDVLLFD